MSRSLLLLLATQLLLIQVISAQDPTDPFGNLLELNTCYSTTNLYKSSTLVVGSKPDQRELIFTFPGAAPKLQLDCLNLVEQSTQLVATNSLCEVKSLLWICQAPENTADWSCTALNDYVTAPTTVSTFGTSYGDNFHWRIEWDPISKAEHCYPRTIFLTMLGTSTFPDSGTVGAAVVFVIIVVLVLGLVGVFSGQQIRRHFARKMRDDEPVVRNDLPPALPMQEAMEEVEEVQATQRAIDRGYGSPTGAAGGHGTRGIDLGDDGGDSEFPMSEGYYDGGGRDTFMPHNRVEMPGKSSVYHKSLGEPLPDPVEPTNRSYGNNNRGALGAASPSRGKRSVVHGVNVTASDLMAKGTPSVAHEARSLPQAHKADAPYFSKVDFVTGDQHHDDRDLSPRKTADGDYSFGSIGPTATQTGAGGTGSNYGRADALRPFAVVPMEVVDEAKKPNLRGGGGGAGDASGSPRGILIRPESGIASRSLNPTSPLRPNPLPPAGTSSRGLDLGGGGVIPINYNRNCIITNSPERAARLGATQNSGPLGGGGLGLNSTSFGGGGDYSPPQQGFQSTKLRF